ncbi:unnamed protein product [Mytilus coruscus]|uniref:DNA-directed DNA polymerase n=1 Tax=Mytilus coruscus TaxID=42192 RepID=A0A6J8D5U1_MYTCO|nr:unnamed protein product [Mytilus coruscus]
MAPKKSFKDIISETTIDDIEEPDATKYINLLKDKIVIDQFPLKIKIIITSEFATPIAFDRIESHYSHPAKVVLTQNNLSKFYDDLIDKFKAWVDQFQERGSGNCIQGFQREETLENTKKICYDYEPCRTIMPEPGKNILEFNNHHFKNRLPFVIYCDFEACNIPMQSCTPDPDKSYTKPISKQEINSYGMYVHSDYPEIYKSQYFHYDGDDVVKKYVEKIMSIFKKITYNIKHNKKDKPILNKYEEDEFQEATECYICGKEFEENNKEKTKKYIVHYEVLKDYIKLGMKVTKVYKTISFKESDWLAKYINFNTEQRTKSKSEFEKDLWKLMNNSFYGKTLEDIRGRSEIKLLTDRKK